MTPSSQSPGNIQVVSAVNDHRILASCLARSPDIACGRLPLIIIEGAGSMSQAYNEGLKQCKPGIILLAHQDVYLPRGFLTRCQAVVHKLDKVDASWMVAGPYGVAASGEHIGRVWDVTIGRELGSVGFAPTPIVSLDELLLILRWDGSFSFDPALPHFHLYGTDLVQSAIQIGRTAYVVELPVVHNNRPIESLGGGYTEAYRYARRKWSSKLPIPTTICRLTNNPFELVRARWECFKSRGKRDNLLADSVTVAKDAGYEG